jgi:hypothetical protein
MEPACTVSMAAGLQLRCTANDCSRQQRIRTPKVRRGPSPDRRPSRSMWYAAAFPFTKVHEGLRRQRKHRAQVVPTQSAPTQSSKRLNRAFCRRSAFQDDRVTANTLWRAQGTEQTWPASSARTTVQSGIPSTAFP